MSLCVVIVALIRILKIRKTPIEALIDTLLDIYIHDYFVVVFFCFLQMLTTTEVQCIDFEDAGHSSKNESSSEIHNNHQIFFSVSVDAQHSS